MELQSIIAPTGKVVITDSRTLLEPAVATLKAADIHYEVLAEGLSSEEVAINSADADVLLVGLVPFRRAAIRMLRRVGLIVRCGVGVDTVDVDAASERGIWVANVPDYAIDEVADHTMLLLLAAARHLNHFQRSWRAKGWASTDYPPISRLKGRTLGIIGLGRIGAQVALRARAFGMEVVVSDPHVDEARVREVAARRVPLHELLRTSDIITLHAPLTPETHHLLNDEAFGIMRPGVILVNTSRGGIIDLAALGSALERETVAAVALDVLDGEPNPDLSMPFLQRDNVTVTPHIAWYSLDALNQLGILAAEEAIRYLRGQQPRAVLNLNARSVDPTRMRE
jgi:D-3-phosphoglycerate dehydrogenase